MKQYKWTDQGMSTDVGQENANAELYVSVKEAVAERCKARNVGYALRAQLAIATSALADIARPTSGYDIIIDNDEHPTVILDHGVDHGEF